MIQDKKVLGIIPARGGSKGIPHKNIKTLNGKPLIAWTILEAKKSKFIDRLILSSDDEEIIKVAESFNCEVPFVRPTQIAQDDTPGIDPVLHGIRELPGYDYVVLLQPTSPLRRAQDIDNCISFCLEKQGPACVSITPVHDNPFWMFTVDSSKKIASFIPEEKKALRRQDLPELFTVNGAIYLAKTDFLRKEKSFITKETLSYEMPRLRSIDIDDEIDFALAHFIMSGDLQS